VEEAGDLRSAAPRRPQMWKLVCKEKSGAELDRDGGVVEAIIGVPHGVLMHVRCSRRRG
jgi:hypothetical protein